HVRDDDPQMAGLKKVLSVQLPPVVAEHAPVRAAFAQLRDATPPDLDAPNAAKFDDWCYLNVLLGEASHTLAWFDEHRDRPGLTGDVLRRRVEENVGPLLIDAGRWADIGRLYADPIEKLRSVAQQRDTIQQKAPPGVSKQMLAMALEHVTGELRTTAGALVRGL